MDVYYRKEIHAFEYVSFSELKIEDQSSFCCTQFENYSKTVNAWSEKVGNFCIVEKNSLVPIAFCPFCGQKINYILVE